jgi:hypothetical protein
MQALKYNLINGPKETVVDYLQTLNNEELANNFNALRLYGVKMPDLVKKMRNELSKRKLDTQAILF